MNFSTKMAESKNEAVSGARPVKASPDTIRYIVEELYPVNVLSLSRLAGFVDLNYLLEVDVDVKATSDSMWQEASYRKVVFKVLNTEDSLSAHPDSEEAAAELIRKAGIVFPQYLRDKENRTKSLKQFPSIKGSGTPEGSLHLVRLLTYLPGVPMCDIAVTEHLLYQCGCWMGQTDKALQGLGHVGCEYDSNWAMCRIPRLQHVTSRLLVGEPDNKTLADDILASFKLEITDREEQFQRGVIHADFHAHNLIVEPTRPTGGHDDVSHVITGLLDLGDLQEGLYVYEIANSICGFMLEEDCSSVPYLSIGGHLLAGYLQHIELTLEEMHAVRVCVAARYVQTILLCGQALLADPDNAYVKGISGEGKAWQRLRRFWETPSELLWNSWMQVINSYSQD